MSKFLDDNYNKLTMLDKLYLTKDTLRFLLDTNTPEYKVNKDIKKVLAYINNEIDYSIGLK